MLIKWIQYFSAVIKCRVGNYNGCVKCDFTDKLCYMKNGSESKSIIKFIISVKVLSLNSVFKLYQNN